MSKSPALIDATAKALGLPEATIKVVLRRLREHDLIDVGGRGPYAKDMTRTDAMRLTLASCAARPLEQDSAIRAVERYETLECVHVSQTTTEGFEGLSKHLPLATLAEHHSLGIALETLLLHAPLGTMFPFRMRGEAEDQKLRYAVGDDRGFIDVKIYAPIPAVIVEHQVGALLKQSWFYGMDPGTDLRKYRSRLGELDLGHRHTVTTIDDLALEQIAGGLGPASS